MAGRASWRREPMPVPKAPPPGRSRGRRRAREGRRPRRRRRGESAAPRSRPCADRRSDRAAINDLLPFLGFVEQHPVGSTVGGDHRVVLVPRRLRDVGGVRGYVPLRYSAIRRPQRPRGHGHGGDGRFVVVSFNAPRRGIDLAKPEFAAAMRLPAAWSAAWRVPAKAAAGAQPAKKAAERYRRKAAAPAGGHAGRAAVPEPSRSRRSPAAPVKKAAKRTRKAAGAPGGAAERTPAPPAAERRRPAVRPGRPRRPAGEGGGQAHAEGGRAPAPARRPRPPARARARDPSRRPRPPKAARRRPSGPRKAAAPAAAAAPAPGCAAGPEPAPGEEGGQAHARKAPAEVAGSRVQPDAPRHLERQLAEGPPAAGRGSGWPTCSPTSSACRRPSSPTRPSRRWRSRRSATRSAHHGQGQWNGVAILSEVGLDDVVAGFADGGEPDADARLISATLRRRPRRSSCTCPTAAALDARPLPVQAALAGPAARPTSRATRTPDDDVVVAGDFNIAPTDVDVYDPAKFVGSHPRQPARAARRSPSCAAGACVDVFRQRHGDASRCSRGGTTAPATSTRAGACASTSCWRSAPLAAARPVGVIDRNARKGKQPIDHAPVVVDLDA